MTTKCPSCGDTGRVGYDVRVTVEGSWESNQPMRPSVPCPCVRVKALFAAGQKIADALDSYAEMRWADILDDWDNALAGDGATP